METVSILRQDPILYGGTHNNPVSHQIDTTPPGLTRCQQMRSSCSGFKPQEVMQATFFPPPPNQDRTSVLVSKIPFIVTVFPYHKPSDAPRVNVKLEGPWNFDLSFVQVSTLSSLFGLLV
jgi:hypothetical protein